MTRSATRFLLPEYAIILRVNVKEAVRVFCENVHINKTVRITLTLAKVPELVLNIGIAKFYSTFKLTFFDGGELLIYYNVKRN